MTGRLRGLGVVLGLMGLLFIAGGSYAFAKTQEGTNSLNALSAAQGVKLTYNEQGQLVDRGETAEAESIMSLLKNDWGYPVNAGDLNPNDPIVNTATEYMYQMATITYHTLHSTQTVVLTKPVVYKGETFAAGEYKLDVNGRYFSQFDRSHPIEGPARDKAWSGTAHALIAELGVGTATASALQLGLGIAALFAGIGLLALIAGIGLVWATQAKREPAAKLALQLKPTPA